MTLEEAMAALSAAAEPGRAEEKAQYHKQARVVLGVPNPAINELTTDWRRHLDVNTRVALADALWRTDVFEARIAAAKVLTQARIRPDQGAWALIASWAPDFDSWAIADHACAAGAKRVVADPTRLDEIEAWTTSDHMWRRRAALVITLPWAKLNTPKPHESDQRERILNWAAGYVPDRDWFIQKAIAWWLRDLSKRAPDRVVRFLEAHGADIKPFARKEASKYLGSS